MVITMKDLKTKFVPISSLNRGRAIQVINDMNESNSAVYIMKNNSPEAVMIPVDAYNDFQEYQFYQRVAERAFEYKKDRMQENYTLEEIMNEAGISEEDLEKVEDIEFDYE